MDILRDAYHKFPMWDRPLVKLLAKKTGLKINQIYKWSWDQKRKESKNNGKTTFSDEFGGY